MEFTLNTKNKSFIMTAGILVLTIIIGYNFIYKVNLEKARALKEMAQGSSQINVLLSEINILQDKIGAYINMRSERPDPSRFSSEVSEIANSCGVKIDSITPGKPAKEGEFIFLPCKVDFTAPYNKLKFFVSKLEGDKKFISVQNLSMSPVRINRINAAREEEGLLQMQPAESVSQMLKKNPGEGIWIQARTEVAGFYCE